MRQRMFACFCASWLVTALAACGGGSGGSTPTGTGRPAPAGNPPAVGSVLVKVSEANGAPATNSWVALEMNNGDRVDAPVNAQGEVLFPNVPAGTTTVNAFGWGYLDPPAQVVQVVDKTQVTVAVTLEPRNAATTVVLGSRVVSKSADGKALQLELDVAVLDQSGQPLTNLVDTAFRLPGVDCGWGPCLVGPTGLIDAWYDPGTGRPLAFGLQPARNGAPVAVGILLDQGIGMRSSEPHRSAALGEFLEALTGNDSALLAEFRGSDSTFSFAPSGGFVTDGRVLLPLVRGLPDRIDDHGSDPVHALEFMLAHLEQQPSVQPKALVAVTSGDMSCDLPASQAAWLPSCRQLAERSRAAGIPITTISQPFSLSGTDLAQRTGGASFSVDFPAQYRTALRGLLPVLGGAVPFYRMRFEVSVGSPDPTDQLLAPGNTLLAFLEVRLSQRDILYADVVVLL